MSDDYLIELKKTFVEDCVNKLAQIEVIILNAEKNHKIAPQQIRDVFNEVHSMKGSSQALGFQLLSSLSHVIEDKLTIMINDPKFDEILYSNILDILDAKKEY